MNIVLVHPHDLFSPEEPWTIRVESIASELVKRGHTVRVVHFYRSYFVEKYTEHPSGFIIISLKRSNDRFLFLRNLRQLLRELKSADVIHFQKCFHYASVPALIASWLWNIPVHYDWDDFEEGIYVASVSRTRWCIHAFLRILEQTIPLCVDTISVASQELRRMCLDRGVLDDRLYDAPVGADLDHFNSVKTDDVLKIRKKYAPGELLILYLGQLNGAQYTDMFLDAAAQIKVKHPYARFLIVGTGERAAALKRAAEEKDVAAVVTFLGYVSHEEVPDYVSAADIAVACFEDNRITRCKSPLKIVEYMAAGKAIVASKVGEVQTMLRDVGMLVKAGSSSALADGIDRLIEDPVLRTTLGDQARARSVALYNWKRTTDTIETAYYHACAIARARKNKNNKAEIHKVRHVLLTAAGIHDGEYAYTGPGCVQIDIKTKQQVGIRISRLNRQGIRPHCQCDTWHPPVTCSRLLMPHAMAYIGRCKAGRNTSIKAALHARNGGISACSYPGLALMIAMCFEDKG